MEKAVVEEIETINFSEFDRTGFANYEEIAKFKNLKVLYIPDNGTLSSLNLSENSKLELLGIFRLGNTTQLKEIDTSVLPHLKALRLEYGMMNYEPPIFETQISRIVKLDLSNNPNLEELTLKGFYMDTLDLSANKKLVYLWMKEMHNLRRLDLKDNTKLTNLFLSYLPKMDFLCINEGINAEVAKKWTLDIPVRYAVCQ